MRKILLISYLILVAFIGNVFAQNTNQKEYKATVFGVKSDGIVNNTASIQKAIDFISENGGGTLVFYVGRYLTGGFELKSNVKIKIASGAVLVCSPNVYEYKGTNGQKALIYAKDQENIGIEGVGTIDGTGILLAEAAKEQLEKGHVKSESEVLPAMIYFDNCKNATVKQITTQNFNTTAQIYKDCKDLKVENIYMFNKKLNAPAWSFSNCQNVSAKDCYLDTKVEPLVSDGSSSGMSFTNCITPAGKKISATK